MFPIYVESFGGIRRFSSESAEFNKGSLYILIHFCIFISLFSKMSISNFNPHSFAMGANFTQRSELFLLLLLCWHHNWDLLISLHYSKITYIVILILFSFSIIEAYFSHCQCTKCMQWISASFDEVNKKTSNWDKKKHYIVPWTRVFWPTQVKTEHFFPWPIS
jgi:hypothetical protein